MLTFKRGAVVHFAMSDSDSHDHRWPATLTFFLPFNRGNDGAAGNPPGDKGHYPVSYFWERVLQKDNWLHIFHRFVLQERKEAQDVNGKTYFKEGLIFPRFHQWEGVTKMIDAVRVEGRATVPDPAQCRLGKTNTIARTCAFADPCAPSDGEPYFHSVIVVTDRRARPAAAGCHPADRAPPAWSRH